MRKLKQKVLAVVCASALLLSSFELCVFAEEPIEEVIEEKQPLAEEVPQEGELIVVEEPIEEEEAVVDEEPIIEEGPIVEEEPIIAEEVKSKELIVGEQPLVGEELIKENPEQINETQIEKKVYIRSEVSEDAKEGDIFKLVCELEGYEEGAYELQWQYITTDWYGNYTGEWSDLAEKNDMELEIVINEENALRAWRVVVTEI